MKKLLSVLGLLLFVLAGCQKGNNSANPSGCSASSYQTVIDEPDFSPVDIAEDDAGNTFVVGTNTQQTMLIKLNSSGNVVWSKSLSVGHTPAELLTLSDHSILLLFKEGIVRDYFENTPDNILIQIGIDGTDNCKAIYHLGSTGCFTIDGKVTILRIDKNGNQVWSKEFSGNYINGNSILRNNKNSFALLTTNLYGKQPDYIYDNNGIVTKASFPLDSNSLNIYNISYEGNILQKNRISNIFNSSWSDSFWPPVSLVKLDDKLVVKSIHYLIYINSSGIETKRINLHPVFCNNMLLRMVPLNGSSYIVNGSYSQFTTIETPFPYTQKMNSDGDIVWQVDESLLLKDGRDNSFITSSYSEVQFYDSNGKLKWTLNGVNTDCIMINCNRGITFASTVNNKLILTRTDQNGKFN